MPNQKAHQLKNGVIVAVLFAALLAMPVYVPILWLVSLWFLPLPIAWYSAKYPPNASAFLAVAALALGAIIGGVPALILALVSIAVGLAIGLSIHYKKSKLFMFMGTSITLLISLMVLYVSAIAILGINVLESFMRMMRTAFDQAKTIMENGGQTIPENYDAATAQFVLSFETVLPTLMVLATFIIIWLLLLILLPILKRLGIPVPKFPPFQDLRLPKSVLWFYLIVILVSLLSDLQPGTMTFLVVSNASMLLQFLLFLQGVSFYHFYIQQEGWPRWVTVLVTILAFPLQSFTSIIGILDLGFDIRGWIKRAHDSKGK